MYRCWAHVPENRPSFSELIEIFSSCPRLIAPCLEVPIASVQTNDSDSVEMGIDPTRKVSVVKNIMRSNPPAPPPPQPQEEASTSPFSRRDSETSSLTGISHPGFNASIMSGSSSSASRARKSRTPVENGCGPTEPLLSMTGDDSYITRYVRLQKSKSPDGVDHESSVPEMTSV